MYKTTTEWGKSIQERRLKIGLKQSEFADLAFPEKKDRTTASKSYQVSNLETGKAKDVVQYLSAENTLEKLLPKKETDVKLEDGKLAINLTEVFDILNGLKDTTDYLEEVVSKYQIKVITVNESEIMPYTMVFDVVRKNLNDKVLSDISSSFRIVGVKDGIITIYPSVDKHVLERFEQKNGTNRLERAFSRVFNTNLKCEFIKGKVELKYIK